MLVDLEAGEEGFVITNVGMYEKNLAEMEGAEGDYQRRSKYMGPREFLCTISLALAYCQNLSTWMSMSRRRSTLTLLNVALTSLSVSRSSNCYRCLSLLIPASFILQYSEFKEQKDYVTWLNEVKGFVDA